MRTGIGDIERLLSERIGLDPTTVGSSLVERAVQRRMLSLSVNSLDAYGALLRTGSGEIDELVEEVVIPETYFFREPEALEAMAAIVAQQSNEVHILSAPCSTGEEPYSIAMALLNAGVAAGRVAIDAIDVSREALRKAQGAVYRGASFRSTQEEWYRFFDSSGDLHTVQQHVRALVTFSRANLLEPTGALAMAAYDFIFCRNLLIYFDVDAQERVLRTLSELLAPGGILVVGAADTFAVRRAGYHPVRGAERAFLFQREAPRAEAGAAQRAPRKLPPRIVAAKRTAPMRAGVVGGVMPTPQIVRNAREVLGDIARLANSGDLEEALREAGRALALFSDSADLHALVGTIHSALRNDALAESSYKRALYLDPAHVEALGHLSVLATQRGDSGLAARLLDRARRASGIAPT